MGREVLAEQARGQARSSAIMFAVLFGGAVAVAIYKDPGWHRGLLGLAYLAILAAIAASDVRTRRAPNRIVYPALAFAGLGSVTLGWPDTMEAVLGGVAVFGALLVVALIGRGAMGFGDVKVGALCGITVGFSGALPMLAITFGAGAILAATLLLTRVRRRKDTLAFTPLLYMGTVLAVAFFPLYLWG